MKQYYLSIEKGSTNDGDLLIEKKFFENMPSLEWNLAGEVHNPMKENFVSNKKVVMISSNALEDKIAPFKDGTVWKSNGYNNNIIPVSIGIHHQKRIKYDIYDFFFKKKKYLFLKLILLPLAFSLGYLIEWIHDKLKTKFVARRHYRKSIDLNAPISARTDESAEYLKRLGAKNVFSTGCVTTWGMKSLKWNDVKASTLVLSFTYETKEMINEIMNAASKKYTNIIVWDQNRAKPFINHWPNLVNKVIFCNWGEYKEALLKEQCDYIGSRLHAGIFAMQNNTRALFISIDNRVVDYSKTLGIKYLPSNKWLEAFTDSVLESKWMESWKGPREETINNFKRELLNYLNKQNKSDQ